VKVTVSPDAPDLRFNLNLPSVSVEAALDALCDGTGLRWQKQGDGYVIAPSGTPQARPAAAPTAQTPAARPHPPTRALRPADPSRPTSPCAAPSAATPCNSTGATARSAARMSST
jgi:hypothetical protein